MIMGVVVLPSDGQKFRTRYYPSASDANRAIRQSPYGAAMPTKHVRLCDSKLAPDLIGVCTKKVWRKGQLIGVYLGRPITVRESNVITMKVRKAVRKWVRANKRYLAGNGRKPRRTRAEVAAPASYFFTVDRRRDRDPTDVGDYNGAEGMKRISRVNRKTMTYMPPKHWVIDGYKHDWAAWPRYINSSFTSQRRKLQNVTFTQFDETIYIQAIRDIKKGEELIGHYGSNADDLIMNRV